MAIKAWDDRHRRPQLLGHVVGGEHGGPIPSVAMTAHPVDTLVNSPANDDPQCVEPVRDLF